MTHPDEVTPRWLTRLLRQNGWLREGEVETLSKTASNPFVTLLLRLEVVYSADAAPALPRKMILKLDEGADHEYRFYTEIAAETPELPFVTCYDARFDKTSGACHLLLHDLSDTHHMLELEAPTTRRETSQMLDTLAQIHARWWGDSRLGKSIPFVDRDFLEGENAAGLTGFFDFLGDRISDARRKIYETVIEKLPGVMARRLSASGQLTLIHDDAHPWNFLMPKPEQESDRRVYLLDWQQWGAGIGAHDAAYHIALFWYPERRQRLERELVQHYHARLLDYGVTHYAWETCWTDYRIFAARNLLVPLWAWQNGHWAAHRWAQMEKALLAFEDLGCDEALAGS